MARPAILLLHAFPLDGRMWDPIRRRLEDAGYAVAAPDLPGEPVEVGMASWARRVLGLADGALVPVGCSMGGYLAFELWRQAGERIRALALFDTKARADDEAQREARDDSIRVLGEEGFETFWAGLAPRLLAGEDPGARELAAEQPLTALVAALETLRDRPDSRDTLPTIDVPVLVGVGTEDRLTPPSDSEEMVAALPNARFLRIEGAGHLSPLERPDEVGVAVAAFLEELPA